ncbi:MAG: tetratricopeptide repeat protein [Phycisphaerae bacterium]|nr:tetratricopeptide repeat protein [Phycisphaerae bacterium]
MFTNRRHPTPFLLALAALLMLCGDATLAWGQSRGARSGGNQATSIRRSGGNQATSVRRSGGNIGRSSHSFASAPRQVRSAPGVTRGQSLGSGVIRTQPRTTSITQSFGNGGTGQTLARSPRAISGQTTSTRPPSRIGSSSWASAQGAFQTRQGGSPNGVVRSNQSHSHSNSPAVVSPARPFGVNRNGLGVTGQAIRPSERPAGYRSTYRAGQPIGGRNLGAVSACGPTESRINNWSNPRRVGGFTGLPIRNGCIGEPRRVGSIVGCQPSYRYFPRGGYCGPGFGFGGGYFNYGGYAWRYPIYGGSTIISIGGSASDIYYDEDVFAPLSTDVEITEQEAEAYEAAAFDQYQRSQAALQDRALNDFGTRHTDASQPGTAPGEAEIHATPSAPTVDPAAVRIGEALGRGDRAFELGRYDEAREEYIRAIVWDGDDPSVRIALGLAEYSLGAYTDASIAIRRGVARSPSLATSAFDLRAAYGVEADFPAHLRMLSDHVAANPDDSDSKFLLGFIHYFSGRRDEGRRLLSEYLADITHDDSVREFIETARVTRP